MWTNTRALLTIISISALAITLVFGLQSWRYKKLKSVVDALLQENEGLHAEVQVQHNDKRSLAQVLAQLSDSNTRLESMLAQMKTTPAEIRYVTRVETKLVASEPVVIYPELPASYTYMLDGQIPVADFTAISGEYKFTTHSLSFRGTTVVGSRDSSTLLQVSSSADGVWHDVPADFQVAELGKRYPAVRPGMLLGIGLGSTVVSPQGAVGVPVFRVAPVLDIGVPTVLLGADPTLALHIGAYNVGGHLPIVDDLWISAGPGINLKLAPSLSVALTTSL